jgi:ABC-2 type transport system ATP-binding protein
LETRTQVAATQVRRRIEPMLADEIVNEHLVAPRSAKEPALEVSELHKSYGANQALRGVSFRLETGERLALLGPNGAGKTSLIRCLCGLTKPDRGSIRLLGRKLPRRGGREAIGLVPQDIALYTDLTARENLVAFGRFHGLRGSVLKKRVEWALNWTGLADSANSLVGTFSGGMKRRVNIACGVLHSPKIVLLDEPTVGVDPQSRERIFEMLDLLSEQGTAILLTTHHLDEAETKCDRIVIIDHGQVAADGTLSELVDQTIGSARRVRLRTTRPIETLINGWDPQPKSDELITRVDDVAKQLPFLLERVEAAGYSIADVEVHSPSLHHVFIHLTGRQLRD